MTTLLAAPQETLQEHLKGVTDEVARMTLKKKMWTIMRVAESFSNLHYSDVKKVFICVAAMHDVGKAYDWFQKRIHHAIAKGEKEFTVPRHELFSTYVASLVLKESFNVSHILYDCALLSILWHHYASRGPVLPRIWDTMKIYAPGLNSVYLDEEGKKELVSILKLIFTEYLDSFKVDPSKVPSHISLNETKKLIEYLDMKLNRRDSEYFVSGNNVLYYVTLPVLSTLQVADLLVANRKRGGNGPSIYTINSLIVNKWRQRLWLKEQ